MSANEKCPKHSAVFSGNTPVEWQTHDTGFQIAYHRNIFLKGVDRPYVPSNKRLHFRQIIEFFFVRNNPRFNN